MHSKNDNIEIMINDEADKSIEEHFKSLLNRYRSNFDESWWVCLWLCAFIVLCHKINLNLGGSYIDSPDWIKKKKPTINPINKKDNKCFQYTATVAIMKTEDIKNDPQRVIKIKPFINKYNWQGINFPSQKEDWKTFQKNTWTNALRKYIQPMFQNITQIVKNKLFFWWFQMEDDIILQ